MGGRFAEALLALGMALAGAVLAWGGGQLIAVGGSWYYLPAGIALIACAAGIVLRRRFVRPLYGVLLTATLAWAIWEAGLDGWALVPRLVAPAVLGLILLLLPESRAGSRWWTLVPIFAIAGTLGASAYEASREPQLRETAPLAASPDNGEWKAWGRTLSGERFSPLTGIDTGNVASLKPAWEFRSDVEPYGYHSFEATPLMADGRLYVCLDRNVVVAIDPDTGKQIWRHDARPNLDSVFAATCRGVSWFENPAAPDCPRRILFGVNDGRMMALDAATGRPCPSFGAQGSVDLTQGLGPMQKGDTFPSSPPTIVNGVAMTSGWVTDSMRSGMPSGGVRGYDATTGKLLWVWDSGRPLPTTPLAPGETYTVGAPNAWGVFSGDEALGLVYFGTGASTPDYWGGHRTPANEEWSTAIVALDVRTGQPRWKFQTVHHDIWDYDVASQPVLTELTVRGQRVPALVGPTKRGQFFVLDRRTGAPLWPVTERPVPQGAAAGDHASPTQPYSAFPDIAGQPLSERRMWGATPLDQLWCRIAFRRSRYEGDFTPPAERQTLFNPGSAGGSNWGSVTIDPVRGLMIANSLYMPDIGRLIPRAEADRQMKDTTASGHSESFAFPQVGTPFAMARQVFLNPLGVPCVEPPYGRITAFDLKAGKVVWSKPLGDARHAGPLGLSSGLRIRMGVPNLAGSIATAGGLVFIGATQDRMIRAFDIGSGRELWSHELPSIGAATPMTYRSPRTGKQYVVIAAGGHPGLPGPWDSRVIAFALPDKR